MDVSTYAVIGNYSKLNPKDCGITRITNGFKDNCFDWYKNPISRLTEGRDAIEGEVPWIVSIIYDYNATESE